MPTEMVSFVVASDCACGEEVFLKGETHSVPKDIYRQLLAAGRVAPDAAAPEPAEKSSPDVRRGRKADAA